MEYHAPKGYPGVPVHHDQDDTLLILLSNALLSGRTFSILHSLSYGHDMALYFVCLMVVVKLSYFRIDIFHDHCGIIFFSYIQML